MRFHEAYPLHPSSVAKATHKQFSLDVTGGTDPKSYAVEIVEHDESYDPRGQAHKKQKGKTNETTTQDLAEVDPPDVRQVSLPFEQAE